MGPFSRWSWSGVDADTNIADGIEGGFRNRAVRKSFLERARKDIQDTLRREGIEKTYEPRVGVWKTKGGKPHPDVSDMDKWGQTPGGKRDLRALKLALEKYPEFDPVELGAVREHWASPKMRSKTAWPAAPSDAPHEIKSTQSPVEMAIWWGPMLAKLGLHAAKKAAQRKLRSEVVKDGENPLTFYHGTSKQFKGDIKPMAPAPRNLKGVKSQELQRRIIERRIKKPELHLSTNPKTADYYALGSPYAKAFPQHSRMYPKYLTKEARLWGGMGDELHGVVTDPSMMIPPHLLAPPPLPNVLPQIAPPLALPYMEP